METKKIQWIFKNWEVGEDGDVFCEGNCVAKVCGAPEGIPESKAVARLIAAAPALLEACKQARGAILDLAYLAGDMAETMGDRPNEPFQETGYAYKANRALDAAIALAEKGG